MPLITLDWRRSKTLKLLTILTNVDQKSLETEFLIAICRPAGDKWQSKTLFLTIFDSRSSIVNSVFDCRISGMLLALVIVDMNCLSLNTGESLLYVVLNPLKGKRV